MLFVLAFLTVLLGIYPSVILDGLHFSTSNLIYGSTESFTINSTSGSSGYIPNGIRSYSTLRERNRGGRPPAPDRRMIVTFLY